MFTDLIKESKMVHIPEFITETFDELRFKQSQLMREMTDYSLILALAPSGGFLTESAEPVQKQGFIKRLIAFFTKMIAKIKDYLDRKTEANDQILNRLQKYLRSVDHGSIEVETYANINSFDAVLTLLDKSAEQVKDYRLHQLGDMISKMGKVEIAVTAAKAFATRGRSLAEKFSGFVPLLSKYNGKDIQRIKEEVLGVKKVTGNIQVEKFHPNFMMAHKFKEVLDQLSVEYGKTLNQLNLASDVSDSLNMLGPNPQHMFSSMVNAITTFFNRNIHLIIALVVEIMNATMMTASQMVAQAKGKGMRTKFEDVK